MHGDVIGAVNKRQLWTVMGGDEECLSLKELNERDNDDLKLRE